MTIANELTYDVMHTRLDVRRQANVSGDTTDASVDAVLQDGTTHIFASFTVFTCCALAVSMRIYERYHRRLQSDT